jgi:hypothetical protein
MADEEGVWRTVGGRRVFIKTGQALNDAMRDSGKFPSTIISKNNKYQEVLGALQELDSGIPEVTIENLRDDLEQYGGTNNVTFMTGDKKKGLLHIEKRHGSESVPKVVRAVVYGKISKFVEGKKTVHIVEDGYEAVLSLDEHGKKKTWLLTGWKIE